MNSPANPLPFAPVPIALLRDRELTATDKLVAALILPWLGRDASGWVLNDILADHAGVSVRGVQRCLRRLRARGWFRCDVDPRRDGGRVITASWRLEGFVPKASDPEGIPEGMNADSPSPPNADSSRGMNGGSPKEEKRGKNDLNKKTILGGAHTHAGVESRNNVISNRPMVCVHSQGDPGSAPEGDVQADRDRSHLATRLGKLRAGGRGKAGAVNGVAHFLARQLLDDGSLDFYRKMAWRVARGELAPELVLMAYDGTMEGLVTGVADNPGAYFLRALEYIESDREYDAYERERRAAAAAGTPPPDPHLRDTADWVGRPRPTPGPVTSEEPPAPVEPSRRARTRRSPE